MRVINSIIVHTTATPEGRAVSAADIDRWHKKRGWRGIGYHLVITLDGVVEAGRPFNQIGAHTKGHNANSIGIVLVGGLEKRTRKPKNTYNVLQLIALKNALITLKHTFPLATIAGHRDLSPDINGDGIIDSWEWLKECPCFDVRAWATSEGINVNSVK